MRAMRCSLSKASVVRMSCEYTPPMAYYDGFNDALPLRHTVNFIEFLGVVC